MAIDLVKQIITDIKQGNVSPIYFLMGEEPYYIDVISNYIESAVLTKEEKEFNQIVLYGRDTSVEDIINNSKRYPMMAERQVVIVKEAQHLSKTIEGLISYAQNPQLTTVLVICYKYKKLHAGKKLVSVIKKKGVLFESKKLYENKIPNWIQQFINAKGYAIGFKGAQMLAEFLGNDLSKISNELDKLCLIIKKGAEITPQLIEENIGISKDFNNFELQSAIGNKDIKRAFTIIKYFGENPRNHPIVVTIALLYSFFSKVLKYHSLDVKSQASKTLGVNPYFIKDYQTAARNYPMKKVSAIISSIREIDVKSKGVGSGNVPSADLFKELLIKIFN